MRKAVIVLVISALVHVMPALAQSASKTKTAAAKPAAGNKYQQAKDLLRRARGLLKDYLAESPGGEDGYFARVQLAALENIFKSDAPVVPVTLLRAVQWRVVNVDVRDSDTKVTMEIENTSADEDGRIHSFDEYPLTLIANKKVYAMKKPGFERPDSMGDAWILQPTEKITIDFYFDSIDEGAIDGIVKYINQYRDETPARFSLMNVNQRGAEEEDEP